MDHLSSGKIIERILDTIANPNKMYIDERIPFYSLRRRLSARMEKHPEKLNEMMNTLHDLIHEYRKI